jgi:hypothetical protein
LSGRQQSFLSAVFRQLKQRPGRFRQNLFVIAFDMSPVAQCAQFRIQRDWSRKGTFIAAATSGCCCSEKFNAFSAVGTLDVRHVLNIPITGIFIIGPY